MESTIIVPVLTFLLGCCLTSLGFVLGVTGKLSKLERGLEDHLKAGTPACPLHIEAELKHNTLATEHERVKSDIKNLDGRLAELERTK